MREIKFRVWNVLSGVMDYEPFFTNNEGLVFYTIHINDVINRYQCENYVLMQYTGIKDKKGKEIYEGDILIHERFSVHLKDFGTQITIDEYGRVINAATAEGGSNCEHSKFIVKSEITTNCGYYGYVVGWDFDEDPEESEVIGNIYENPEIAKDIK